MYASSREKGFTLLELMITVAVVGILAAISIPSYMSHMVKVRRAAAAACLMEGAQYAERHYTTKMTYVGMEDGKIFGGCAKDIEVHYTVSSSGVDAKKFTLNATPINQQASRDTKCGTLSIGHTGKKEAGGPVNECW